jgi:hypothetical protein
MRSSVFPFQSNSYDAAQEGVAAGSAIAKRNWRKRQS